MNPLIPILGSSLLGGLGAFFGGGPRSYDPAQLAKLYGPQALLGDWSKIYQGLQFSPQFQNALMQMQLQGGQLSNNLSQGLAERGLTGSGIGTVAEQMGRGAGSMMQSQALAGLSSSALDIAQQNLMARLGATVNQRQYPSPLQNFFGSFLSSAGPALAQYYAGRQQQQGGGGTKPTAEPGGIDARPPNYGVGGTNPNAALMGWQGPIGFNGQPMFPGGMGFGAYINPAWAQSPFAMGNQGNFGASQYWSPQQIFQGMSR